MPTLSALCTRAHDKILSRQPDTTIVAYFFFHSKIGFFSLFALTKICSPFLVDKDLFAIMKIYSLESSFVRKIPKHSLRSRFFALFSGMLVLEDFSDKQWLS